VPRRGGVQQVGPQIQQPAVAQLPRRQSRPPRRRGPRAPVPLQQPPVAISRVSRPRGRIPTVGATTSSVSSVALPSAIATVTTNTAYSVTFRRREMAFKVGVEPDTPFTLDQPLNPCNNILFPWLSKVATNFDMFIVRQLQFLMCLLVLLQQQAS
jgi:hypothetical protein